MTVRFRNLCPVCAPATTHMCWQRTFMRTRRGFLPGTGNRCFSSSQLVAPNGGSLACLNPAADARVLDHQAVTVESDVGGKIGVRGFIPDDRVGTLGPDERIALPALMNAQVRHRDPGHHKVQRSATLKKPVTEDRHRIGQGRKSKIAVHGAYE